MKSLYIAILLAVLSLSPSQSHAKTFEATRSMFLMGSVASLCALTADYLKNEEVVLLLSDRTIQVNQSAVPALTSAGASFSDASADHWLSAMFSIVCPLTSASRAWTRKDSLACFAASGTLQTLAVLKGQWETFWAYKSLFAAKELFPHERLSQASDGAAWHAVTSAFLFFSMGAAFGTLRDWNRRAAPQNLAMMVV